jgi:TRAP-type C4-dicarboxylate transport system permease small subunit
MMLEIIKNKVNRILEWVLITLMAVNVLNVLWQVFTRFVVKDPSSFTEELARYLLIWVGLLGASYAAGQKMHLAIDIVLKAVAGKIRNLAELCIQLFIFLFAFFVMVIGGIRLVVITLKLSQISAALRLQLGYVYLVLPLSGLLIMFYASVFFMERMRSFKGTLGELEVERAETGAIQE